MQIREVDHVVPAPITTEGQVEVRHRKGAQSKGGRYALAGPLEVLDVGGYQVKVGSRADGAWVAYTRDKAMRQGRRSWYDRDRDALLAKVAADVVARPPALDAPAPAPEAEWPGLTEHLDPAPVLAAGDWHVVHATPGEYPMAAALDALDASLAPALAALEAAGKTDAADLIRAEVSRTPLESELLALYRRVLRGE